MNAPLRPVPITAAELRALAGFHEQFAETNSLCGFEVQAEDGRNRAILLRGLAEEIGPPEAQADGLLGVQP